MSVRDATAPATGGPAHRGGLSLRSDANAAQVDELQCGLDSGPCLTALRQGEEVRIDDLAADLRWAAYRVRALAHGVRSSLSMPLFTPDRPAGVFNLYSDQPGFFGAAETRLAERFAREATVAVGIAARLAGAFDILRSASQNRNVKVREIAEQIIATITGQPPQEPPFSPPG